MNRPKRENILTVNEKTSLSTFQFMKIMKKETETKKEKPLSYIHTSHHRTWSSIDKKKIALPSMIYSCSRGGRREGKDFWVFGWIDKKMYF